MRRIWAYIIPAGLALAMVSVIMARPFGVWMVPPDDPNTVEMEYGGAIRIEIVSQRLEVGGDPNSLVLTTVLRVAGK